MLWGARTMQGLDHPGERQPLLRGHGQPHLAVSETVI